MKTEYTTREAAKITGVEFDTIDYWVRKGIVTPSAEAGTGTGTVRRFDQVDILAIKLCGEARNKGIVGLSHLDGLARTVTKAWRFLGGLPEYLVYSGGAWDGGDRADAIRAMFDRKGAARKLVKILLPVDDIVAELREKILGL
jgi:hypothetical protein